MLIVPSHTKKTYCSAETALLSNANFFVTINIPTGLLVKMSD